MDDDYHSIIERNDFQLFEGIFIGVAFLGYITFHKENFSTSGAENFYTDCKNLIKNSDDFIFYFSMSCQFGLSFIVIFDMYGLLYLLLKHKAFLIRIHMIFFILMIFLGAFLIDKIGEGMTRGLLAKIYMGLSILLMFLLNFVFRGPIFNYFLVLILGFTMVSLIPLLKLLCLQTQKNECRTISVVFVYWLGFIFFLIFEVSLRLILNSFEIYPSIPYSFVQIFTFTSILSVYDERIILRDSQTLLFN
jgi:hypothetical protein